MSIEVKIISVFCTIAECEDLLEISRRNLCGCVDFNCYGAFNHLDKLSVRGVSAYDLQELFQEVQVEAKYKDLYQLIQKYDFDKDGRLSLPDFFSIVLPNNDITAREIAQRRSCDLFDLNAKLALVKHLDLEIYAFKAINERKRDLVCDMNFDYRQAFNLVSLGKTYISGSDLQAFLHKFGFYSYNLDRIIQKFDGQITFANFCDEFKLQQTENLWEYATHISNSVTNPRVIHNYTENKICNQIEEILSIFQVQIAQAKELENFVIELNRQPDFSSIELFKAIDKHDKAYINTHDLIDYFNLIGIRSHEEDVYLIMKRYSQYNKIKFSNFERLLPLSTPTYYPSYNEILNKSTNTLCIIKNLFLKLVECEGNYERLRQQLFSSTTINLRELFQRIDTNKDGFITEQDLKTFLNGENVYISTSEASLLFRIYDKSQNGHLSYFEFREELTPKL